jgi:hypothetical protein
MTSRTRRLLACAFASIVAAPMIAFAQQAVDEEGPIVIGQRRTYEKAYFTRPEFALDLRGIYQRDDNTTEASNTTSNQYIFEQFLEARTQGYILSPNFFDLSLYAGAGLSESFINVDTDGSKSSDQNTGTLYEWDFRGTFQPNGQTPLSLYSRREQGWIFRDFGPALQTTTTDTGAALDIRSHNAPTRFGVSHLESEQSGLEDIDDFTYVRDAFDWHTTYLATANQTWNWDYNFSRVSQEGVIEQKFDTHDARLGHEVVFGANGRHSLNSTVNYYQQSGDADLQRFRWDERLRLRHTDDFRTKYDYTFEHDDIGGINRTRHRAAAGFTHDLFDSLTTTGNAGVQYTSAEDAENREIFAGINWLYKKQVPLGLFSADLGLAWSKQDAEASTVVTQVIDQPAAFSDSQPIVIVGTNVNPNTLVITDPSGLILYQEGLDYTVQQFADRVEIDRIIGGRIANAGAVLLDYQLTPLPAATTTSNSFATGVRYDFEQGPLKGLTLFGRYARSNQDIETDQPTAFAPNEFTDIVYGLQYRFWNVTLGAEHQDHDSTINPFEADRLFARYSQRVRQDTLLGLNAAYTSIDYFEPINQVDLTTASAQLVYNFTRKLTASMTLLYRYEDDRDRGVTTGFEEQFELRWRHRQTQVYAVVRNAQLESPGQDQSFQFFQLGIRREF